MHHHGGMYRACGEHETNEIESTAAHVSLAGSVTGTTPAEVLDPAGLFPSPDDDREDESGRGDGREGGGPVLGSGPGPGPGPGSGLSCTEANPCLFDVEHDPTEQDEIAAANPAIVARLKASTTALACRAPPAAPTPPPLACAHATARETHSPRIAEQGQPHFRRGAKKRAEWMAPLTRAAVCCLLSAGACFGTRTSSRRTSRGDTQGASTWPRRRRTTTAN